MTRSSTSAAAPNADTPLAGPGAAGRRDGGLDLLRGVATLSVLLFHL
jgi:hypothetical protein